LQSEAAGERSRMDRAPPHLLDREARRPRSSAARGGRHSGRKGKIEATPTQKEPQMNDIISPNKPGTSPEQATVRLERMLPGPIERVWAYLTDSEKRKTWFAGGVFDLRVGGRAELHFDHSLLSAEKSPPEMQGKRFDYPETI